MFRETQLAWAGGYVNTLVGDSAAETAVSAALDLYPANAYQPRENLEMMRAATLVQRREVDAGLNHALGIVTDAHSVGPSAARNIITQRILRAVPADQRNHPAARDLRAITRGVVI
ncbi:hypothetical protein [Actinomadura rubrisoli]|uniref:Uncharacterized protein n=1 Tax=Actinomadura rubrisoli TaxID=2530368 RepID=A0A4R4ZZ07_9ACTN|nr:hypothetical protein [Actinomadura rubrisoli]TDD62432.1 hypothetical protein E1298_44655 [Actinomadura rubrisoli]